MESFLLGIGLFGIFFLISCIAERIVLLFETKQNTPVQESVVLQQPVMVPQQIIVERETVYEPYPSYIYFLVVLVVLVAAIIAMPIPTKDVAND